MTTHYTVREEELKMHQKEITKEAGADEPISVYLFVIQDAQINFEDGRFKEISY